MSLDLLCDPVDLNLDAIKLGSIKPKGSRRSEVRVFNNKKEIQLKTGVMKSVYGAQMNSYKKDEHYIELTTTDQIFIDSILALDQKIVEELGNCDGNLFGQIDSKTPKENFMGIARVKNPFTIRLILSKDANGFFDWSLFDHDKKELKVTSDNVLQVIPKGTLCKVIFSLDRVWYFQDRFGIICKLKQMKLEKEETKEETKKEKTQNYLFLD
jgi:hypothetical protein